MKRPRSPTVATLAGALIVTFAALLAACVPSPAGRATPLPAGSSIATPLAATARPTPSPSPQGPSPTLTFGHPTATPLPSFFVYRVRTGDTITSIARRFETTARSIGFWNRAAYPSLDPDSPRYNPNDIRVGWRLAIIPGAEVDEELLTPPPASAEPSSDA